MESYEMLLSREGTLVFSNRKMALAKVRRVAWRVWRPTAQLGGSSQWKRFLSDKCRLIIIQKHLHRTSSPGYWLYALSSDQVQQKPAYLLMKCHHHHHHHLESKESLWFWPYLPFKPHFHLPGQPSSLQPNLYLIAGLVYSRLPLGLLAGMCVCVFS